jgi:long-chain acyl-CoA synthetase
MNPFLQSASAPDKPAVLIDERVLTYGDLDRGSRALAAHLRQAGVRHGDTIAILAPNCAEFFVAAWSAQRSGLYFTPIGRHLKPQEIAYQLTDSGAKVLFVHHSMADRALAALDYMQTAAEPSVCSMGGTVDVCASMETIIAEASDADSVADIEGSDLLYTSGTTGRPKGVKRPLTVQPLGSDIRRVTRLRDLFEMDDQTIFYTPAPIYHAAPLRFAMTIIRMGATLVLDDKFDPTRALKMLCTERITHSQWVPTMFVRMLDLPGAERALYHAPSHRKAIHSGAPCSIPVKRAMIEWWGPILHEYYSGTESAGFTHVTSEDWLRFPGTVGKPWGCKAHILSDDFVELGHGEIGNVYFEGASGLTYHNDEQKTRDAHSPQGWATLGDIGCINKEGFLFLSDRKSFVIVSGGVNIYPKEIEDVLDSHADVLETAVFGVPDPVFGETVQAVVQLHDPARAAERLAAELHALAREKLASYKAPKFIAFVADLPRLPSGKLEKHRLREEYRAGRDRGFPPKRPT